MMHAFWFTTNINLLQKNAVSLRPDNVREDGVFFKWLTGRNLANHTGTIQRRYYYVKQ